MPLNLAHLNNIQNSLNNLLQKRIDGNNNDFNRTPVNGIASQLQNVINNYNGSSTTLEPYVQWIAYHLGMIVSYSKSQSGYVYGPCPQPPPQGYNGDLVQYWLGQMIVTLAVTAPNLGGQPPGNSGDPLSDIDTCVKSIPTAPTGYPKHDRSAPGKS